MSREGTKGSHEEWEAFFTGMTVKTLVDEGYFQVVEIVTATRR